jgi:hypothetical protein
VDGEISQGWLPAFSLDTYITITRCRRPLENFSRKSFGAFTNENYVEPSRSEKRVFGRHEID